MNFWKKLKKPIFVLAPMADVTDSAFRKIIAKYGKPDVMWTEFVSADGLARATPLGKKKLLKDLEYSKKEKPIVAQLFSANPEHMFEASKLVKQLGFDGLDINMGCPDRSIEKQGAGAAMIKNPKLAREIIRSAKAGFKGPVSVKTRIGYNKDEIETWIPEILKEGVDALTIHLRTRKEMSNVPAQWGKIKRIIELRNQISPETLILGNGDIKDLKHARELAKATGVDGVMLGRAIFGTPSLFSNSHELENRSDLKVVKKILKILVEHTKLFEKEMKGIKNFSIMKKHFKAYVTGFAGAQELRSKLMLANNAKEVEDIISCFLKGTVG